jgi:hypothetical protein
MSLYAALPRLKLETTTIRTEVKLSAALKRESVLGG